MLAGVPTTTTKRTSIVAEFHQHSPAAQSSVASSGSIVTGLPTMAATSSVVISVQTSTVAEPAGASVAPPAAVSAGIEAAGTPLSGAVEPPGAVLAPPEHAARMAAPATSARRRRTPAGNVRVRPSGVKVLGTRHLPGRDRLAARVDGGTVPRNVRGGPARVAHPMCRGGTTAGRGR